MKTRLLIGILETAMPSSTAFALADYRTIDRTRVLDGRFDCAPFDSAAGRVLLARSDFSTMINAQTHAVSGH